jgi:ferredoxin
MFSPDEKRYTHSVIINLNADLRDKSKPGLIVPIDYLKKAIADAGYRSSMNTCICRDASHCIDYPHDVCCIFLGEGARILEQRGLGYEISLEDAEARVNRAAELGLIGNAIWIEVEQFVWGVKNENMNRFLEICFCCPCCCVAINSVRNATAEMQRRFESVGWQAVVNEACTNCGLCVKDCPQQAITMGTDRISVNEKCFGCGICKTKCPYGAITLELLKPLKENVTDYFRENANLDLNLY